MNSLEQLGAAQLLAAEGQLEMARLLARALGRGLLRIADKLGRYLPQTKMTPW
jgi:hypothetical protein